MSAPQPEDLGGSPPSSPASAGPTPVGDTLATHGQAAPAPADSGDGAVPPTRLPPAATPSFADSTGRAETTLPRRFGDYELLEEIAHGGMGIVYKARQQIGGGTRLVALKMMLAGGQAAPTIIERFLTEARAAATLEHPHIVPIYDVGAVDGQHYFTMQLMPGGSLQQRLAAGPLPPREAARLVHHVAEAVQHAHDQGIIHRDIKPHNILLAFSDASQKRCSPEGFREASLNDSVPKLADFGLVRTRESGLSVSGEALGTPSYMPPEQARGELQRIGPPSDVYGLGAVLYALLTGRPPFQSADLFQTMRQVCEEEPLPPRQLNPAVPRDLGTVCLKCLEKEPARRYASAAELAEELGRFARGEPVQARPVGRLERGWRWCRRNPAVAGLLAVVALTLALGAGVASVFAVRANNEAARANEKEREANRKAADEKRARKDADTSAREEKKAKEHAEGLLYASQIGLALSQWRDGNVAVARDVLDSTNRQRRGWEYRYLNTLFNHLGQRTFLGHKSDVRSVAFNPDGKRIVSGSQDRMVKVWEAQTGQELLTLNGHTNTVTSVAFSPDGQRIASGSDDRAVKVWDVQTGQETRSLQGHTSAVTSVAFSPDGQRIASGSKDATVKVWDAQTGQELLTLNGHTNTVTSVTFSSDGQRIASGSWDTTVKVWEAQTGQETLTLKGHTSIVFSVTFSPDGQRIASGSWDETMKVWEAQTGQQILSLKGHANWIFSVAFSPDGKQLASGSRDRTVKVWDARTGQQALSLTGHTSGV